MRMMIVLLCSFWMMPLWSQTPELSDQQVLDLLQQPQPRDHAIDQGLAWLRKQQRDDGSFADGKNRVAVSSLALMAHLAAGSDI